MYAWVSVHVEVSNVHLFSWEGVLCETPCREVQTMSVRPR